MENLKFEFRAVFKFLCKEGRAAKEIHDRLRAVYGDSTAQLPDGQMSFGGDVNRSKMTWSLAGRLTLLIYL